MRPLTAAISLMLLTASTPAAAERCLFISSYHSGDAWADKLESGLRRTLGKRCELRQFDMDTKRQRDEAYKVRIGLQAKRLIEDWRPDVVIAADDNASKYVVMPWFRDADLPFVFCGVNWTIEEYGYPYRNATGMVEVAPIRPLLENLRRILPGATRGVYLGADTLSEHKNLTRVLKESRRMGLHIEAMLVDSGERWLDAFRAAQEFDFLYVGSSAGIDDWDEARAEAAVLREGRKLSVTNHDWMMPFSMFGMTKVPYEQGEWAAKVAIKILDGVPPSDIPIIPNRRWDTHLNSELIGAAGIAIPADLHEKSKRFAAHDK